MGQIDFLKLEAIAMELAEESGKTMALQTSLEHFLDETGRVLSRNPEPAGGDPDPLAGLRSSEKRARKAAEILELEAHSLQRASESLRKILLLYRNAEKRALAVYSGECRVVPRTEFGTSYFENLRPYQFLMPVYAGIVTAPFKEDGDLGGILE